MANFNILHRRWPYFTLFFWKGQINNEYDFKNHNQEEYQLGSFSFVIIKKKMTKQQIWTLQEDQMLLRLHRQAGCFQRWKFISAKLKEKGILKTQFQCRDRFINHLDPDLKLGKLTKTEIVKLFQCYDQYGPRWSFFQTKIKGRSQNMLKNQFYSTLRSLLRLLIKIGHKKKLYTWKIESVNYSSKLLADLYQGRKSFYSHKNFFRSCLKNIGCCVEKQYLQNYLTGIDLELLKSFYQLIYEQIGRNQCSNQGNNRGQFIQIQNIEREKNYQNIVQFQNQPVNIEKQSQINNNLMIAGYIMAQNPLLNNQWNLNSLMTIPMPVSYSNNVNMFGSQMGYSIYYYRT